MKNVAVFDIDGTLANCEHRVHFARIKPKNYKAFEAGIPHDTLYDDMHDLLKMFSLSGYKIIICTGREEKLRKSTEEWLAKHHIHFDQMYMCETNDHRGDQFVKVELLHQIIKDHGFPRFWVDDRQRVVDAIRAEGVRVLQCQAGDF